MRGMCCGLGVGTCKEAGSVVGADGRGYMGAGDYAPLKPPAVSV